MKNAIMVFLCLAFTTHGAFGSELEKSMSPLDFETYVAACKKMYLEAKPKADIKDVEMGCRDPYLKGSPNESKEDKVRRERLIKESEKAKESAIKAMVESPENQKALARIAKDCKKAALAADPGKDPKDAEMLCSDPYLQGKPNETYEDQVRRKRLIQETDKAKENALDSFIVPKNAPAKKHLR